ncbi:MAG: hypothetical protein AB7F32_04775, partial [Victivallaceae bacterium]
MLKTVDFCGLKFTKLLIGANPFGGYSHQNEERDIAMRSFHTREQIFESWERAWKAGINTFVTNNETPHVIEATAKYLAEGGKMQWVAQLNGRLLPNMEAAIDQSVGYGAVAGYFHGALVDDLFAAKDADTLKRWVEHARKRNLVIGCAGHNVDTHYWVDTLNLVDFHAVPFFNCGSVHSKIGGERFQLDDVFEATKLIRILKKPCIAYKVHGAGRNDAKMAFDYAIRNIKPGDVINVGKHRCDNDNKIEDND